MRQTLLFCLAIFLCTVGKAQDQCGTDEVHSHLLNTDLEYRAHYYQTQEQIQHIIDNGLVERGDGEEEHYVIPVVVHVIHLGEAVGVGSNISDAQIIGAINGLNDRYSNAIGNGLDINMSFCLAKRDPDGCPTNGIVRVNGIGLFNYQLGGITRGGKTECSNAASDHSVKDLSKWSTYSYYNIWVVHAICGGWAGYANYPVGNEYDGAVMLAPYMTGSSTTLAHELGHAFNLPHTFNGDNNGENCPPNSFCSTQGDGVCDTPPHKINDCGFTNPCTTEGIWDNSRRNYMSYCGATDRFTQGQKERIRATLLVPPRMNLLNSPACLPSNFGTTSVKGNESCIDACDGSISVSQSCEGEYSYLWSNGETGSSIQNLCPGNYSVTISDADSQTEITIDYVIEVAPVIDVANMINIVGEVEFCEGESVVLSSMHTGTYSWSNGSAAASIEVVQSGNYSLTLTTPQGCELTSTEVMVTVHPNPVVSFVLPETINYMANPFTLNTGNPAGGEYWGAGVSEGVFYPALAGVGTHVVFYSYTDSNGCFTEVQRTIIVEPFVSVEEFAEKVSVNIYPNPNDGTFQLTVDNYDPIQLSCYDVLGKLIYSDNIPSQRQSNQITVNLPNNAKGIYFVKIATRDQVLVRPILVEGR